MARKIINVGTADKGNGDPLRVAFSKANDNFAELYNILSNNTGGSIITTDVIGSVFADDSTLLVDGINGRIPYSVLSGAPTIPAAQVQSNWTAASGMGVILNKPTFATVATSGAYADLTGKPTIPTSFGSLVNGANTVSLGSDGVVTFPGGVFTISNYQASTQIETWTVGATNISPTNSISFFGHSSKLFDTTWTISGSGITGQSAITAINPIMSGMSITGYTVTIAQTISTGLVTGDYVFSNPPITQGVNLSSDLSTWTFGNNGSITFPDGTTQTTATNAFSFRVAADDSTQRTISNNESIKFTGAGGITTASDAEGNITINYVQGDIRSDGNINIEINLADSTLRRWQFGEDGDLILPAGGDIKNSTGTSVLGGSVSSLVNGAYTASLGNTGALTLPAGGIISEGGGLTGAIKLRPAGGANANQALLIYPTAGGDGDHIHLTAGGGATELYLGDDSRYVKLVNGGDIAVFANNGAVNRVYNWAGQGGWNSPPYTNLATTGGTGTGLRVNVTTANGGYTDITAITIHTAGTGYTVGDVITITNENNLTSTFQIGVAAAGWTFGTDGSLASEEFKIKTLNGVPNSINTPSITDTQFWDLNYGSNLATTGGTGSGLFVNVSDGGSGYASISINVAGTGYSPGDIITVTNGPFNGAPYASSATFIIGVSGTRSWTFDRYGALTLPSGNSSSSSIQSVQNGNYQSKVTVSPFQILSQARTSQSQSYSMANGDFTVGTSSDGNGMINFVSPTGSVTEFITDTMENGGVYERTVRLNGTGPEYGYSSFNGTDQVSLGTAAPAGAVTSIRFSYTRISKIDINPDNNIFRIESEPGCDIDIQAGDDLQLIANDRTDITAGGNMRLRAGDGSVQIKINYAVVDATEYTWEFGTGGRLILPNNTILKDTVGNAIAFGNGAGQNSQGGEAVAIGTNAGYDSQGADAVAIGTSAGETSQGTQAVAIGDSAGYINQGDYAVAIGHGAGNGTQGSYAVAIGTFAGQTNQTANSIIINASGAGLDNTAAGFYVKPVRQSDTANAVYYNSTTGEITYSDTFSFSVAADDSTQRLISNNESIKFIGAGKINTASDTEGNITITGADTESSWTVTTGTNTYSFTVPMDGTYVMWVKGNIPNGIIIWNATVSVSNTNVPAIGYQYAWNYTGGGTPISLTSIPNQIKGTAGTISTDATYAGTTSNRFDFGISNTSGASQTVYYGYTRV